VIELEDDIKVTFDDYYITEGSEVWLPSETGLELVSNVVQPLYGATDVVHYYGSEEQLLPLIGDTTFSAAYLLPLLALGGGGGGGGGSSDNDNANSGSGVGGGKTTPSNAPVLDNPINDFTIDENDPINGRLSVANNFSDADSNDVLTYTATLVGGGTLPGWLSFDLDTGAFSGVPLDGDVGVINVIVTASDGSSSDTDTFSITVGSVN
jgi:hypothetical protein